MSLLAVDDVSRSFPQRRSLLDVAFRRPLQALQAVCGVDLTLAPGETLGIVGESGCGKSTLARMIVGLQPLDSGSIRLKGKPLNGPDRAGRLQMIFQDPYSSLNPRMTIGALLSEALARYRPALSRVQRREEVLSLLDRVGLAPALADSYPGALSGGQRQRVSIARALCPQPEVLIADEPVSALDASVQAQIINLFQKLKEEEGIAILFISHDMQVVAHLCDRVAVMYLGEVVEMQSTAALFENPLHPYTQGLIAAVPRVGGAQRERAAIQGEMPDPYDVPEGCRFAGRCPLAEQACAKPQALRQLSPGAEVRCWKSGPA